VNNKRGLKVLRAKDVVEMTGLSRSSIYQKVTCDQFPKQIKLGARAAGWIRDEVVDWLDHQIKISRL